jgi:RNA polymerase II subunit A small phosphatase-like protein
MGVFVVERPQLKEFLRSVAQFAEVVVYTAGEQSHSLTHTHTYMHTHIYTLIHSCNSQYTHTHTQYAPHTGFEDYAKPIIDAIDPTREFITHTLYRDSTLATEHYQCVKDMNRLSRPIEVCVCVFMCVCASVCLCMCSSTGTRHVVAMCALCVCVCVCVCAED